MREWKALEFDMREFCLRVLGEYETVIATIIQRPLPTLVGAVDRHLDAIASEGAPSERAGDGTQNGQVSLNGAC